ncbi:MAG: hypothetical protein ACRYFX_06790 [Janthinobacterium lividum]
MKTAYFLLLSCLLIGAGFYYRSGRRANASPVALLTPARAQRGLPLGVGTVLVHHFYPLVRANRGPVRYLYANAGQHVPKGELLVKYEDHSYFVAPLAGLIVQPDSPATTLNSFPALWFDEAFSFRLRLPLTATNRTLCPGQQVRLLSQLRTTQLLTAKVGSVTVDGRFLVLSLRLQTEGNTLVPVGAQVRVEALLPLVE